MRAPLLVPLALLSLLAGCAYRTGFDLGPANSALEDVFVVSPEGLVASKALAYHRRKGSPKAGTDGRDLAVLLLAFPDLKVSTGPVRDRLVAAGADAGALESWDHLVAQEIVPERDEDEF